MVKINSKLKTLNLIIVLNIISRKKCDSAMDEDLNPKVKVRILISLPSCNL